MSINFSFLIEKIKKSLAAGKYKFMKLSNFNYMGKASGSEINGFYYAKIDVQFGLSRALKVKQVFIYKRSTGYWMFVNSGEFAAGDQAEKLCRSFEALRGLKLHEIDLIFNPEKGFI